MGDARKIKTNMIATMAMCNSVATYIVTIKSLQQRTMSCDSGLVLSDTMQYESNRSSAAHRLAVIHRPTQQTWAPVQNERRALEGNEDFVTKGS